MGHQSDQSFGSSARSDHESQWLERDRSGSGAHDLAVGAAHRQQLARQSGAHRAGDWKAIRLGHAIRTRVSALLAHRAEIEGATVNARWSVVRGSWSVAGSGNDWSPDLDYGPRTPDCGLLPQLTRVGLSGRLTLFLAAIF